MLKEAQKHRVAPKKRSLFSLGGRGYYENPLSDLLAYFLDPGEDHGLGDLFLRTFLSAVGAEQIPESFKEVSVQREFPIDGGRLDILAKALEFGLVIETKVNAGLQNDLMSYEKQVRALLLGIKPTFAVLAPTKPCELSKYSSWGWVSFDGYATLLESALGSALLKDGDTKWIVFARELISHLRDIQGVEEIMKPEELRFVEENMSGIKKAQNLESDYRAYILQVVNQRIAAALEPVGGAFRYVGWGFICDDPSGKEWRLLFQVPLQGADGSKDRFYAGAWISSKSELAQSFTLFANALECRHDPEKGGAFWGREFSNVTNAREDALLFLERFVEALMVARMQLQTS